MTTVTRLILTNLIVAVSNMAISMLKEPITPCQNPFPLKWVSVEPDDTVRAEAYDYRMRVFRQHRSSNRWGYLIIRKNTTLAHGRNFDNCQSAKKAVELYLTRIMRQKGS